MAGQTADLTRDVNLPPTMLRDLIGKSFAVLVNFTELKLCGAHGCLGTRFDHVLLVIDEEMHGVPFVGLVVFLKVSSLADQE